MVPISTQKELFDGLLLSSDMDGREIGSPATLDRRFGTKSFRFHARENLEVRVAADFLYSYCRLINVE